MPRVVTLSIATGACLLCGLLGGCERKVRAAFQAESLAQGDGPIGINESIVIRFNRPMQPWGLSPRAVSVRDDRGRGLPVHLEAYGCNLLVSPLSPRSAPGVPAAAPLWPAKSAWLDVLVPFPVAGAGVRGADGEENTEPFERRIRLTGARTSQPGFISLREWYPPDGARDVDFMSGRQDLLVLRYEFDAPIDASSLRAGIQLVDEARQDLIEDVVMLVDPADRRRVEILPFAGGVLLGGGTAYAVTLTESLRAEDGRTLAEPRRLRFWTRSLPGNPRILKVAFEKPSDFDPDPAQQSLFNPQRRLIPKPLYHPIMPPGSVERLRPLLEGIKVLPYHPLSPPGSPTRTQILIPGEWLRPPAGKEERSASRFLIAAIDVHIQDLRQDHRQRAGEIQAQDLQVTLGPVARLRDDVPVEEGLSPRFELNEDERRSRPLTLKGSGRIVSLTPPESPASPGRTAVRVLHLEFEEPYLYDVASGDLVLGLRNLGGIWSEIPLEPGRALGCVDLLGLPAARNTIVLGRATDPQGEAFEFQPHLWIHTRQIPPTITRWYVVGEGAAPQWFRGKELAARGDAREFEDFDICYQAGRPLAHPDGSPVLLPDGTVDCEAGAWSRSPPDGARALRLRIEFDPRMLSPGNPAAAAPLRGIDYVPVGYRDP